MSLKLVKTILSCCVAGADCVLGWRPQCIILYYHTIPEGQEGAFRCQLDTLLRVAKPISAVSSFSSLPAKQHAAVTFDDGFVSAIRRALPELNSRGIPRTFFVPAGQLGRSPRWASGGDFDPSSEVIVSEAEIRKLAADELTIIGSHGLHHVDFTKLTEGDARHELMKSKQILEAILQKPVTSFSFPFGKALPEHVRWAHDIGYTHVFGTDPQPAERNQGGMIGRVRVDPWDSPMEFRLKIGGAYRWLPHALALKRSICKA